MARLLVAKRALRLVGEIGEAYECFLPKGSTGERKGGLSPYSVQTYFRGATRFALMTPRLSASKVEAHSWVGI